MKNHIVSSRICDNANECLEKYAKKNRWTVSTALADIINIFFDIEDDEEAA